MVYYGIIMNIVWKITKYKKGFEVSPVFGKTPSGVHKLLQETELPITTGDPELTRVLTKARISGVHIL